MKNTTLHATQVTSMRDINDLSTKLGEYALTVTLGDKLKDVLSVYRTDVEKSVRVAFNNADTAEYLCNYYSLIGMIEVNNVSLKGQPDDVKVMLNAYNKPLKAYIADAIEPTEMACNQLEMALKSKKYDVFCTVLNDFLGIKEFSKKSFDNLYLMAVGFEKRKFRDWFMGMLCNKAVACGAISNKGVKANIQEMMDEIPTIEKCYADAIKVDSNLENTKLADAVEKVCALKPYTDSRLDSDYTLRKKYAKKALKYFAII